MRKEQLQKQHAELQFRFNELMKAYNLLLEVMHTLGERYKREIQVLQGKLGALEAEKTSLRDVLQGELTPPSIDILK